MAEGYGYELLHAVMAAHLTPAQREVFIDHRIIGRPFRELALERGVTHNAVRELCDKARKKLAAVVEEELAA